MPHNDDVRKIFEEETGKDALGYDREDYIAWLEEKFIAFIKLSLAVKNTLKPKGLNEISGKY